MKRVTLTFLLLLPLSISTFAQAADATYMRPGTLIRAGEHRLNFYCMGEGSPTVVMEGGFGDWSPACYGLQQRVATFTRTCSYDRAGFGFSEPGPMPRSAERLADELHTAQDNGGIAGPYFLVALAFGSVPARMFADRFTPEVAGLVLISPDVRDVDSPEMADFWKRFLERGLPQVRACRDSIAAGKPLPTPCYRREFHGLPDSAFSPELSATLEGELARTSVWDTMISEMEQIPANDAYLKEHRTSFGSRPARHHREPLRRHERYTERDAYRAHAGRVLRGGGAGEPARSVDEREADLLRHLHHRSLREARSRRRHDPRGVRAE